MSKRQSPLRLAARSGQCIFVLSMVVATTGCLPLDPPPYPHWGPFRTRQGVIDEAARRSAALEQYIEDWLDGRVPAEIPLQLLPETERSIAFRLVRPDEITPEQQWGIRPAHTIDWSSSYGLFNDPHATYLVNWHMLAPFGSRVVIEGRFPRARYFSVQALPSFEPENYRHGPYGTGEISWVDADITPLPGHTNPFRPGASRTASQRSYRLECNVAIGDPLVLDQGAFTPPFNRRRGNLRHCTGMAWRGGWGDPAIPAIARQGEGYFGAGELWVRYYAPDRGTEPLAEAGLPRVTYVLPDGREYFIAWDISRDQAIGDARRRLNNEVPAEPSGGMGPGHGFGKLLSILRSGAVNAAAVLNHPSSNPSDQADWVRRMDRGIAGKGEDVEGLGSHESSATTEVHINYLTRNMCLGGGRIFALSGRLPTTPNTRGGQPVMTTAQARYWSITGYSTAFDFLNPSFVYAAEITSVMDDEIVRDANNGYILAFGRAADRPSNATATNGVTFVEWGPEACQTFLIRWLTVGPEWAFDRSPVQTSLGWEVDSSSISYNPERIGRNHRNGFLGDYQPIVSYLTRAQFEALGGRPNPLTLPRY